MMTDKILVVNAGPIYPVRAMNQMRTHNMIRILSKDFRVDLLTTYIDDEGYGACHKAMSEIGGEYIPVRSLKNKKHLLRKRAVQILEYLSYYIFGTDREVTANMFNNRKILKIIKEKGYRIIISNYWEASLYFKDLGEDGFKILDPHYAVGENIDVLNRIKRNRIKYFLEKRKLMKSSRMESSVIAESDLLLPLSPRNMKEFLKIAPEKPMILIADGADLDKYLFYPVNPDPNTILFYGAMGSAQNKLAFYRFYDSIFPRIKSEIPTIKLLVVGSGPPDEIKALHDNENIIVTGFVEDVRPWLSKAWLKIIPLELGSGFRGRVIELMAMGIPVVGSHNALDCIGLKNGEQGFISDSNEELTKYCIDLIKNPELRNMIGFNAKSFVNANYSLESTFGKLREYLKTKFSNASS